MFRSKAKRNQSGANKDKRMKKMKKEQERVHKTEVSEEGAGLQIKSTASSHPVSPTCLPASSPPSFSLVPCSWCISMATRQGA